jgi:hypothetical protein
MDLAGVFDLDGQLDLGAIVALLVWAEAAGRVLARFAVALELADQSAAGDAQRLRGPALIVAVFFQRHQDGLLLHLVEAGIGDDLALGHAGGIREAQVFRANFRLRVFGLQHRAEDRVLELAHVARPVIAKQGFHRVLSEA